MTAKQAADFLRGLDDRHDAGSNSLAIAFGGGHGAARTREAMAAVRELIKAQLGDAPRSPFGDSAA